MIYNLTLIFEEAFVPYVTYDEVQDNVEPYSAGTEELAVNLLSVNKMTCEEAANVLFSMKIWHMSNTNPYSYDSRVQEEIWNQHLGRFRQVRVSFDHRDYDSDERIESTKNFVTSLDWNPSRRMENSVSNMTAIHDMAHE